MKLKFFRIFFSGLIFILFLLTVFISYDFSIKILKALTFFQFIPSLVQVMLHGAISGLIGFLFIIILTIFFGRIYCSFLCPLGIYQDIIIGFRNFFKLKFKYIKPIKIINYSILLSIIISVIFINIILLLFDPYSIFMRILTDLVKPFVFFLINKAVVLLSNFKIYFSIYNKDFKPDLFYFLITLFSMIVITVISFIKGRLFCNLICPVGTILGIISKFSIFKIKINKECISCGKCERSCKGECIDAKNKTVDNDRCITCFNCLNSCPYSLIEYKTVFKSGLNNPKREMLKNFLGILLGLAVVPSLFGKNKISGNIIKVSGKKNFIIPPGAINFKNYINSCTSCHLCITKCPSKVIRPVFLDKDKKIFQPALDYSYSYCDYECNICTQVCPTQAIKPLSLENKKLTQIGIIDLNQKYCIAYSKNQDCGACSEHCPTKAVYMIPYKNIYAPITNEDICIGCGACEYVCPARPVKAIKIKSNLIHKKALRPETGKDETIIIDKKNKIKDGDFPF